MTPEGSKGENVTDRLLNDQVTKQVRDIFKDLKHPVQVLLFTEEHNCDYCADTQQLVREVVALSEKLHLEVYDLKKNADIARQYKVDKTPMIVLAALDGDQVTDYGIRLSGIPAGHEFSTLIHDLILVSGRDSGLSKAAREFLATIKEPVHLQVFVTPT
jgi:glutaredoxin-like protein